MRSNFFKLIFALSFLFPYSALAGACLDQYRSAATKGFYQEEFQLVEELEKFSNKNAIEVLKDLQNEDVRSDLPFITNFFLNYSCELSKHSDNSPLKSNFRACSGFTETAAKLIFHYQNGEFCKNTGRLMRLDDIRNSYFLLHIKKTVIFDTLKKLIKSDAVCENNLQEFAQVGIGEDKIQNIVSVANRLYEGEVARGLQKEGKLDSALEHAQISDNYEIISSIRADIQNRHKEKGQSLLNEGKLEEALAAAELSNSYDLINTIQSKVRAKHFEQAEQLLSEGKLDEALEAARLSADSGLIASVESALEPKRKIQAKDDAEKLFKEKKFKEALSRATYAQALELVSQIEKAIQEEHKENAERLQKEGKLQEAVWEARMSGDSAKAKAIEKTLKQKMLSNEYKVESNPNLGGSTPKEMLKFADNFQAIFKPDGNGFGSRSFAANMYSEKAASKLNKLLGFDVVPKTVIRKLGNEKQGSVQYFVQNADSKNIDFKNQTAIEMLILDYISGNSDRRYPTMEYRTSNHNWVTLGDRHVAIDNGLAFRGLVVAYEKNGKISLGRYINSDQDYSWNNDDDIVPIISSLNKEKREKILLLKDEEVTKSLSKLVKPSVVNLVLDRLHNVQKIFKQEKDFVNTWKPSRIFRSYENESLPSSANQ